MQAARLTRSVDSEAIEQAGAAEEQVAVDRPPVRPGDLVPAGVRALDSDDEAPVNGKVGDPCHRAPEQAGEGFQQAQREMYAKQAREVDIIITTALIPGKPAPRLITAEMVRTGLDLAGVAR